MHGISIFVLVDGLLAQAPSNLTHENTHIFLEGDGSGPLGLCKCGWVMEEDAKGLQSELCWV